MVCVDEGKTGSPWLPALRAQARVLATILGVTALGASAAGANAEERTLSLYHIHTKERITITYWKDGRFIPSALRKLNWFLRDWRKDRAVRMDPRTIDLIWKLHADLGSKEPIHIISGHRSAATNAMLRRIGRKVARRSRHITGQAIDFKFPDVPTWKVRNLALAYGIGGVGYYGRNGFVHVDTGRVRHWPRMSQQRVAGIIRKYRRYIGRGWKSGNDYVMVASRKDRPSMRIARRPVALPGVPKLNETAGNATGAVPRPKSRPYEVLVLAASRMEVTPASAPATVTNFDRGPSRDPIGMVIASLPREGGNVSARYPRVNRRAKGDLAVALLNGTVRHLPVMDDLRRVAGTGKGDLGQLGVAPAALKARDGAPYLGKVASASMYWPGLKAQGQAGGAYHGPQRVNRSGKGDLLTSMRMLPQVRAAALRGGAEAVGALQPLPFR